MMQRILLTLMMLFLVWSIPTTPLTAQDAVAPAQSVGVTADEVNVVARQLWCPLCSGVRLDSCELKACDQMRQEIALKLDAGQDAESIKADFLAQYGPQVLGEPPREGFNWLAWLLPVVVMLAGAIFLLVRGRSIWTPRAASLAPSAATAPPGQEDERLARQLDEELKRYG